MLCTYYWSLSMQQQYPLLSTYAHTQSIHTRVETTFPLGECHIKGNYYCSTQFSLLLLHPSPLCFYFLPSCAQEQKRSCSLKTREIAKASASIIFSFSKCQSRLVSLLLLPYYSIGKCHILLLSIPICSPLCPQMKKDHSFQDCHKKKFCHSSNNR